MVVEMGNKSSMYDVTTYEYTFWKIVIGAVHAGDCDR